MNCGAIEFKESKWTSMYEGEAIDLMIWLDNNLEPGYNIYRLATGNTYFVGDSDTLFEDGCLNKKYPIYEILQMNETFSLNRTVSTLNL